MSLIKIRNDIQQHIQLQKNELILRIRLQEKIQEYQEKINKLQKVLKNGNITMYTFTEDLWSEICKQHEFVYIVEGVETTEFHNLSIGEYYFFTKKEADTYINTRLHDHDQPYVIPYEQRDHEILMPKIQLIKGYTPYRAFITLRVMKTSELHNKLKEKIIKDFMK